MAVELRILALVFVAGFWVGVAATLLGISILAARVEGGDLGEASFGIILGLVALIVAGYFLYLAL